MSRARTWIATEWRRSDRLLYLVTAAATSVVTYFALELWAARLTVPLQYSGDAIAVGAHFKTVIETGWYESQSLLSAPYGQVYYDFPSADNLHFMVARVLALFTSNWPLAMNIYYLIGFPLAAISALWLLRRLGISRTFASVLGIVYAIAPYHFFRGESHLWLASYYVIPFAVAIVMMAIRGEALWKFRETGPRLLRWATPRTFATIAILALTATAQSYYAVFFLILLAFAGIARLIRSGEWSRFWGAAIAGVVTVIVMLMNMAPDILYTAINGPDPGGFERGHAESEIYALKLAQLLLPWPGHRIEFLRNIRAAYDAHYPLLSEDPALGAIAAFGFVALFLILAAVVATWGSKRARTLTASTQFVTLTQLASLTFVAFIFSMVGGLSTIISFVTASIRGWNRMSIVIALLCLIAVGILADAAVRSLQKRVTGRVAKGAIAFGLAGVLLVGGYIDQTPANASASYADTIAHFDADQTWIDQVERAVPKGSLILQLPYEPFPETVSATGTLGTDTLIPFLHSNDLRWSGGGIKGRPRADWPGSIEHLAPADIATLAAAAGFAGIHIDRASMTKADDAALETGLVAVTNAKMSSADGRYAFFPLATIRASLEATHTDKELADIGARVVDPVTVTLDPSFQTTIATSGSLQYPSVSLTPFLTLTNERKDTIPVVLTLELKNTDSQATGVDIGLPDGTRQQVAFAEGAATVSLRFDVAPGTASIPFTVNGSAENLAAALVITKYSCVEDVVAKFLAK